MTTETAIVKIEFDPLRLSGRLVREVPGAEAIWDRLRAKVISEGIENTITERVIELPWSHALAIVREFGTRSQQQQFGFRFHPEGAASDLLRKFGEEIKATKAARERVLTFEGNIQDRLTELGFTKRSLKSFQLRDLQTLLQLPHGANFSVPGAGKTTVTFALHLLVHKPHQRLLVIGPKSSFGAWREVVGQCLDVSDESLPQEQFCVLAGC